LTDEAFERWVHAYGRAWEARDVLAFTALFTESAPYHWTPFETAKAGRAGIARAFIDATSTQTDIHFQHEILAFDGRRGIASWRCRFERGGALVRLDGILLAEFDLEAEPPLCRLFREWWHSA